MVVVTILASLVAGFLNASSAVLQRLAAGKPEPQMLFSRDFIVGLVKSRMWLMGMGLQLLAFGAQAVALGAGSLVVVAPLLTTDLIFLMLLLHFVLKVPAGLREWGAAVCISAGLSALLYVADPHGGHLAFNGVQWALASAVIALIAAVGILIMRTSPSPRVRAGVGGVAGGVTFALVAAFTKLTVEQLHYGIGNVFTSWELYALLVTGIFSMVLMQNMYASGPLAISQPAIEITDPFTSVIIGVLLFGDMVDHSAGALAGQAAAAVVLAVGIILMGGSKNIHRSNT